MNQVNLLRDTLKEHLPWHGARLNFLALFLMALIRVRTVDLSSLSGAFRTSAKPESSYKRLQRFFSQFDLDFTQSDYAHRWGIETLFGMFKTKGFNLESTHFNQQNRLSKLFALMSLAMCWAILMGEWRHQQVPLKVKNHG
jgi:hypothetical protein